MNIKETVSNSWSDLDPNKRRAITLIGSAVIVMAILFNLVKAKEAPPPPKRPDPVIKHPLTGTRSQSLDMDSIAGELQRVRRTMEEQKRITENFVEKSDRKRLEDLRRYEEQMARTKGEYERKLSRLEGRMVELEETPPAENTIEETAEKPVPNAQKQQREKFTKSNTTQYKEMNANEWEKLLEEAERNVVMPDVTDLQGTDTALAQQQPGPNGTGHVASGTGEEAAAIPIYVYGDETADEVMGGGNNEIGNADSKGFWLSAGSMLSGVLINGLDAPTGQGAKKDPYPVVVRVKKETIMPNLYTMDLQECFMVATGFGELSSERAFFRAERLSCIRDDGSHIEQVLDASAVGPDGKTGVRGRLVERNGRLIAMSILAGSLSGLSDIFRPVAITSVQTEPGDDTLFQTPDLTEAGKAGAASGVSSALERIADYYFERADAVYPLVQVDAGIAIDFVVLKGAYIKPNDDQSVSVAEASP